MTSDEDDTMNIKSFIIAYICCLFLYPMDTAASYLPFVESGKEWYNNIMLNFDSGVFPANSVFYGEYEMVYDTATILEKEYQRLLIDIDYISGGVKRKINTIYPITPLRGEMFIAIREEQGKVYAVKEQYIDLLKALFPPDLPYYVAPEDYYMSEADDENEVLLYDFTLEEGQRYPCIGEVYVATVSSLTTQDGLTRKVMMLTNGAVLVEGIGCVNSIGGIIVYQNYEVISMDLSGGDGSGKEAYARLSSCYTRDDAGFHFQYRDEVDGQFLNTLTAIRDLPAQSSAGDSYKSSIFNPQSSIYFDLSGRRLSAPPAKGMYIEDKRVKMRE